MTVWKFLWAVIGLVLVFALKLNVLLWLLVAGILLIGGIVLYRSHKNGGAVLIPAICVGVLTLACVGLALWLPDARLGGILFF